LVATWHEFWGEHWHDYLPLRPAIARIARSIEAGSTRLGDVRTAVSQFTADRLAANGAPIDSLRIVGNGVDVSAFADAPRGEIESDIVFLGRLIEDKQVDVLLEALALLSQQGIAARCVVIGDGPERLRLQILTTSLGLDAHVRFVGEVEEQTKLDLLHGSRLLASPSIREGFGIVALEAQAAGLVPIVASSRHSATASIVRHGVDALVCEPNSASLMIALRSLLTDADRLLVMRQAAMQAAQRADWDLLAPQMEAVYGEVVRALGVPGQRRLRRFSWL
jgi:Glycosyltransferase